MAWLKDRWVGLLGKLILAVEAVRILSEFGFVKSLTGALSLYQIYEFARDHIWSHLREGPLVDFLSLPLVHAALILGGILFIWWDNRRTKKPAQTAVAPGDHEKQLPAAPPIQELPAVAAPIPYTATERERLIEALHDCHNFIRGEPQAIAKELHGLREQWYHQIAQHGAIAYLGRLNAVIRRLNEFWRVINDLIYTKHAYYKEEVRTALNIDRAPNEIVPMINKFAGLVHKLPEGASIDTIRIIEEQYGALLDTNWVRFQEWLGGANDRIESMTSNLRKTGLTGFEKTV